MRVKMKNEEVEGSKCNFLKSISVNAQASGHRTVVACEARIRQWDDRDLARGRSIMA